MSLPARLLVPVWSAANAVRSLACFCIVLSSLSAFAAQSEFLIDVWDRETGLPSSSVTSVAQTPDGYLWVGTHNGLARFDGVRFVTFDPANTPELPHARVIGLFVDAQGTLWINTFDGSLTSYRAGRFTHEWNGRQVLSVFSVPDQIIFALWGGDLASRSSRSNAPGQWQVIKSAGVIGLSYCQDGGGTLWYLTRDGAVGRLKGTSLELLPRGLGLDGQKASHLTTDPHGRIWVATDKEIAVWDGEHFQDRTPTNGESPLAVSLLLFTGDDSYWAVVGGRVRKCVDRRWVAEAEAWRDLLVEDATELRAHKDRQGGVWFCHFSRGLFYIGPDGNARRISAANGLPGDRVSSWLQDREGNVWAGVIAGGLVRLRERRFRVIGPAEGLPAHMARTICEDSRGAIWIGTEGGGLNRWEEGALMRFALPEGAAKEFFYCACSDTKNRLWLSAGREDLYVCEEGKITQSSWRVHGIKVILADQKGRVWLGRKDGLTCLANGKLENFGPGDGVELTDMRAIAEDKQGDVWVGAGDGCLYHFREGKFTAHRSGDKLGRQPIWSLLLDDDGTIWVGTFRGGLLRFKDGQFTRRCTTENGLPSDVICQILDDGQGSLWMGSHNGIFQVPKTALDAFERGKIKSLPCVAYGRNDGLPTLECSGNYQPSGWRSRDGRLWFATLKGVVSIQPAEMSVNLQALPVLIEDVVVDGDPIADQTWRIDGSGRQQAGRVLSFVSSSRPALRIPPGNHQFEFHYTAPSYVAPENVRFRYKLEGLETEWVEAGTRRSAQYSHLRPGDYRFQVITCNNNGVWNKEGSAVALKVLPHFWETAWFSGLLGVTVVGALVGTVRFVVTRKLRRELKRLEQHRAIERDRARIAKDIHDDLGAGLTQIMLQSALARRNPQQDVQTHLGQISETARELIRAMDEIVWAVNPQNDTLEGLVTYICKFAQEYLMVAGVRCRLNLPAQLPPYVLSTEARHNLFLAIKEALNNVVKHARATEVRLELSVQPKGFTFLIRDNGQGLASSAAAPAGLSSDRISSGHGLGNMTKRLEAIGGRCSVASEPGTGTRVEFTVHFKDGHSPVLASGENTGNGGE